MQWSPLINLYHGSHSYLLMSSRLKHYWSYLFFVNGDRHIPPPKTACGLKDWGYYCKRFSSILRSIVLTIQKVCWLDFLQVPRGRCGKNTITSSTTIVKLSKRTFACFNDKQSTQYHKKPFWFDKWNVLDTAIMRVATSRKQVTNPLCICVFCCKTNFKSNLKLINESI